jgi:hypothetical protein
VAGAALAASVCAGQGGPVERLQQRYPEVRAQEGEGRVLAVFGVPMTTGRTAEDAAAAFLAEHGEVFGPVGLDLQEVRRFQLEGGRRTVFAYRQHVQGLPVWASLGRVMVLRTDAPGAEYAVTYAAAHACNPAGALPQQRISPEQAIEAARAHPRGEGMEVWTTPTPVVHWDRAAGPGEVARAWEFRGHKSEDAFGSWTFVVDAFDSRVLLAADSTSSGRIDDPVAGTVSGKATTNTKPDTFSTGCGPNAPASRVLQGAFVGAYSLTAPTGQSATVRSILAGSSWAIYDFLYTHLYVPPPLVPAFTHPCDLVNLGPVALTASASPTVNFTHNATPSEFGTAAVNAFVNVELTQRFFTSRLMAVPGFPCLSVLVNHFETPCNGFYSGGDPGDGGILRFGAIDPVKCIPLRPNTAHATWISHEYGHYIMDQVFAVENTASENRNFHEGYSDATGFLVHDTPIFGEDFGGCGTHAREPAVTNRQYPMCPLDGDPHVNGELLGGIWLDIREEMNTFYGNPVTGLDKTSDLFAAWSTVATGGSLYTCTNPTQTGWQSAGPDTLVQVLVADDDDGSLGNGTPHLAQICTAFGLHSISSGHCADFGGSWSCRADCDAAGGVGVLDAHDFLCFQKRFEARDPSACNFDMTTGPDVCDVFDLIAFQSEFAAGCP